MKQSQKNLHILLSLSRPWQSQRHISQLMRRHPGKAHLFPIGHNLINSCVRLTSRYDFDNTIVIRGVSYPSKPSEGGADINLKPGNASFFFARLEDERRVLKLARMRTPTSEDRYCEYTISREGYISYHKGDVEPLLKLLFEKLPANMTNIVRPYEKARGRFVTLSFPEPVFTTSSSYKSVVAALGRLPRTSMAVLHANPYFHATLTNYEDGGGFDVFITDSSSVHLQSKGGASPATFLQLHNYLSEIFRDATVSLEKLPQYTLLDLLEGRV